MRAAVFVRAGKIELQERPIPQIGATDALLRVTTTTICGTDIHILKGEYPVAAGRIVGHEPVGTIAALGATLALYRDSKLALTNIPTLAMITATLAAIRRRCETLATALRAANINADVVETVASVGAGAFPTQEIASAGLAFEGDATTLEQRLRAGRPSVIGRISDGRLILDLRSVPAAHDRPLTEAILSTLA